MMISFISNEIEIGKNSFSKLQNFGINTAYDLVKQDDFWIQKLLTKRGLDLKYELLGEIRNPINPVPPIPKSTDDKQEIKLALMGHLSQLCTKLRENNLKANGLEVILKDKNFVYSTQKILLKKNDFFIDSSTLVEVYNCILEKTPAVSKNVHFSGNCLTASCFLNVRIGQTIGDIVKQIGGFSKQPAKIIINGETYGNTVSSLNVPITKYVKSVLFISAEKKLDSIGYSCVNCGCCRDVCPVGLSPDLLYNYMVNNHKISDVYIKSSILCTECGLCNANCKSRLPLFQTIAVLKNQTEK